MVHKRKLLEINKKKTKRKMCTAYDLTLDWKNKTNDPYKYKMIPKRKPHQRKSTTKKSLMILFDEQPGMK